MGTLRYLGNLRCGTLFSLSFCRAVEHEIYRTLISYCAVNNSLTLFEITVPSGNWEEFLPNAAVTLVVLYCFSSLLLLQCYRFI